MITKASCAKQQKGSIFPYGVNGPGRVWARQPTLVSFNDTCTQTCHEWQGNDMAKSPNARKRVYWPRAMLRPNKCLLLLIKEARMPAFSELNSDRAFGATLIGHHWLRPAYVSAIMNEIHVWRPQVDSLKMIKVN